MSEKKLVSTKVIGSANPIARKMRDIKSAIAGILGGIIAIIIGFVLIVASVTSVKENSKTVANLPLQAPSEAVDGMVKIKSKPSVDKTLEVEWSKCGNEKCNFKEFESEEKLDGMMYYSASWERLEVVKETRTETETKVVNGKDVEETYEVTEYNEEWVEKNSDTKWADFLLGGIKINMSKKKPKLVLNYEEKIIDNVYIDGLNEVQTYDQEISSEVGDTRLVITYLKPNKELTVVGELKDKKIEGGDSFIITDQADEELFETLKTEEATTRIVLRFISWLLLTIGFAGLLAPIMEFIEMIPIFGKMAKFVAGVIGAIIAALIVLLGVIIVKFWYIFLILFILLLMGSIGVVAMALMKKKNKVEEPEK